MHRSCSWVSHRGYCVCILNPCRAYRARPSKTQVKHPKSLVPPGCPLWMHETWGQLGLYIKPHTTHTGHDPTQAPTYLTHAKHTLHDPSQAPTDLRHASIMFGNVQLYLRHGTGQTQIINQHGVPSGFCCAVAIFIGSRLHFVLRAPAKTRLASRSCNTEVYTPFYS